MEEKFILYQTALLEENNDIEFKGIKELSERNRFAEITDFARENVNAFVNGNGGVLYIGIEKDGLVTGVELDRNGRDEIQRRISQTLKEFYPSLETSAYKLELLPILSESGEKIKDSFIIKISVERGLEPVYWMSQNKTGALIRLYNEKQIMHPRMIEKRIKDGRIAPLATKTTLESFRKQKNNKAYPFSAEDIFKRETVSKQTPSVYFKSKLPVAYCNLDETSEGEFIFSRFEGLSIEVSRQTILSSFMLGLGTPLEWLNRPYLRLRGDNLFEATLGDAKLILSTVEVIDLCECIDEVCEKYKQQIIDAENHLQTWSFCPVHEERNFYGFEILSIKPSVWDLMYKFSKEFHNSTGSSNWHIFDTQYDGIKISRNFFDQALLIPRRNQSFGELSGTEYLDIIYIADDVFLQGGYIQKRNWKEHIGEYGIWSAEKTKQWVINKFIPKVADYYRTGKIAKSYLSNELPPLEKVQDGKNLASYVVKIQEWFPRKGKIQASLVAPYYYAFLLLLENATVSNNTLGYILGKITVVDENITDNSLQAVLQIIDKHTAQVIEEGYDNGGDADHISRVFIAILEEGNFVLDQYELNKAIKSLHGVLQECLFESRHCDDVIF